MDPIGHGTGDPQSELDIRIQLGEEARVTTPLETHLARLKPGPIPTQFPASPQLKVHLGELRPEERAGLLPVLRRLSFGADPCSFGV
jgi:hypothetical protein